MPDDLLHGLLKHRFLERGLLNGLPRVMQRGHGAPGTRNRGHRLPGPHRLRGL